MKITLALFLALAAVLIFTGCETSQKLPRLPRGSYAYVDDGYSKDAGFYARGGVHIPLDGYAK